MRNWVVAISAVLLVAAGTQAQAVDITTKKILIKDNTDPTKRQVLVLSKDLGVTFAGADTPNVGGAAVHIYSATDDQCTILDPGSNWQNLGTKWKYKDTTTRNLAQIKDGRLLVKIKSNVTFSLADDAPQGDVNVQVQFGTGTRYCLRCSGNTKDDAGKFLGKNCAAAACDAEPTSCDPPNPTTTTSTSTSTTSTSTCPPGPPPTPTVLKGSLPSTAGRFNYNLTLGLPGANSACNTSFAGTHACTITELQAAAAACDTPSLMDTNGMTVTSFWVIDPLAPPLTQCVDDAAGGSNLNWEYGTAHTPSRGQRVDLNNTTGALGPIQPPQQCNLSSRWVGCCQ